MSSDRVKVLATSFNQDDSCLALGTEDGFAIYNCSPLREIARRDIGGVGLIAMLFRTNYVAIVGGGKNPVDSSNKVLIWDDVKEKIVVQIEFKVAVLGLKIRADRLIVTMALETHVFSFPGDKEGPKLLDTLTTFANPHGLVSVCSSSTACLLAIPGQQVGHVHVIDVSSNTTRPPSMIKAHEHELACITLSVSGEQVATASTYGTLIRVFNTRTKAQLFQLRRGLVPQTVHTLRFNRDASFLVVTSERSVHLFALSASPSKRATFHTPAAATCAFGADRRSVLALCAHDGGTLYSFAFNDLGPCPEQNTFSRLLKQDEASLFQIAQQAPSSSSGTSSMAASMTTSTHSTAVTS